MMNNSTKALSLMVTDVGAEMLALGEKLLPIKQQAVALFHM
jgi:hypothetical protein